jgi:hypothetical protein
MDWLPAVSTLQRAVFASAINNAHRWWSARLSCPVAQCPGARLVLVGDGPQRQELEQMFQGMPVKFMVSLGS